MKRQNKLRTYLAVTAGVGCAGSVSNAAVVMIDVSDLSGPNGGVTAGGYGVLYDLGGLDNADVFFYNGLASESGPITGLVLGGLDSLAFGVQFGGPRIVGSGALLNGAGAYSRSVSETAFVYGDAIAPAIEGFGFLPFRIDSGDDAGVIGFLQVTFDGDDTFEILGGAFESVAGNPITTFDTTAVPEPSSLVLLALGATGLAARRKRKMAA